VIHANVNPGIERWDQGTTNSGHREQAQTHQSSEHQVRRGGNPQLVVDLEQVDQQPHQPRGSTQPAQRRRGEPRPTSCRYQASVRVRISAAPSVICRVCSHWATHDLSLVAIVQPSSHMSQS
jgi:hypothetical protein